MTSNQGTKHGPEPQPRRFEQLLGMVLALATLFFSATVVGAKLFLIYLYGWHRVQAEHLHFLAMPKGRGWPVSNGDVIREGHFVHFLISLACWFVLFGLTYLPLRLLLPKKPQEKRPLP